jgi:hypothetical protein
MADGDIFKFKNGDNVRDVVTGFTGVIMGRTQWLNGCVRYCVQSKVLKDGAPNDFNFDEEQLELTGAARIIINKPVPTGGPRPDATRGHTSKR